MTEQIFTLWIREFENDTLPLSQRLEAAASLLLIDHPAAEEAAVRFLDLAPAHTELGLRYRELVVTHGAALDALCVLLWEDDSALQLAAADAIREIGDPEVVPELAAILRHQRSRHHQRDTDLIISLIEALGGCWRPGSTLVAVAMAEALSDPEEDVRDAAGGVLRQLGPDADAAAPGLIRLLGSPEFRYRFEAVELLPRLTSPARFAPHLLNILRSDEDSLLRWMALHELQAIQQPGPEIEQALREASTDTGIQEYAAAA